MRVAVGAVPLHLEPSRVGWSIEGQFDAVPGWHRIRVVRGDGMSRWRWRGGREPFAPSAESEQVQQRGRCAAFAERWASSANAHVQGEVVRGVGASVAQTPPRGGALVQRPVRVCVPTFLRDFAGEQPALAVIQDDARDTCQPFPPSDMPFSQPHSAPRRASSPTPGVC